MALLTNIKKFLHAFAQSLSFMAPITGVICIRRIQRLICWQTIGYVDIVHLEMMFMESVPIDLNSILRTPCSICTIGTTE